MIQINSKLNIIIIESKDAEQFRRKANNQL